MILLRSLLFALFFYPGTVVAVLLSLSPLDTILMYAGVVMSLAALVFYAVDMFRAIRSGASGMKPEPPAKAVEKD